MQYYCVTALTAVRGPAGVSVSNLTASSHRRPADVAPSLMTVRRDLTASPSHSFREPDSFSSRKAEHAAVNAADPSQGPLSPTEPSPLFLQIGM